VKKDNTFFFCRGIKNVTIRAVENAIALVLDITFFLTALLSGRNACS
jgi:hypothetical protein